MTTIVLDSTKSLKASSSFTGGAPTFITAYADATTTSFLEASTSGYLISGSPVTLVTAPSSGVTRIIRDVHIYATSQAGLSVYVTDGASPMYLTNTTLAGEQTWSLNDSIVNLAFGSSISVSGSVVLASNSGVKIGTVDLDQSGDVTVIGDSQQPLYVNPGGEIFTVAVDGTVDTRIVDAEGSIVADVQDTGEGGPYGLVIATNYNNPPYFQLSSLPSSEQDIGRVHITDGSDNVSVGNSGDLLVGGRSQYADAPIPLHDYGEGGPFAVKTILSDGTNVIPIIDCGEGQLGIYVKTPGTITALQGGGGATPWCFTGDQAHNAVDNRSAYKSIKIGGYASSSTPTAVTVGNRTEAYFDTTGHQHVKVDAIAAGTNNIGDVDVASVIPGTGATNLGKAEDASHSSGDVGVMALGVVVSSPETPFTSTEGDYTPLGVTPDGALWVRQLGDVSIASIPAGTNSIGKLGANSGVDIGDVDITSIVPGTGATNLGKVEDTQHSSGDVGVLSLAVRSDGIGDMTSTNGDYSPLVVDRYGALKNNPGDYRHRIVPDTSYLSIDGAWVNTIGRLSISVSGSGDNTIVTPISSSYYTSTIALSLIASSGVTATFKTSGTGAIIAGPYYLAANVPLVLPTNIYGWFQTGYGSNTILNLSSEVPVGGSITYVQVYGD